LDVIFFKNPIDTSARCTYFLDIETVQRRRREMKVKAQGHVFEFAMFSIGRGEWGYRLETVDGGFVSNTYSDADYRTERDARKAARRFASDCRHDRQWGWCCG
jgi:hypothetical protein